MALHYNYRVCDLCGSIIRKTTAEEKRNILDTPVGSRPTMDEIEYCWLCDLQIKQFDVR